MDGALFSKMGDETSRGCFLWGQKICAALTNKKYTSVLKRMVAMWKVLNSGPRMLIAIVRGDSYS